MENLKGNQAAYSRLLSAAYDGGAQEVKRIALDFTPECREHCIGMAFADIDNAQNKDQMLWPYMMVANVLDELIAKDRGNSEW